VAKALVERRLVRTVQEAFDRYLATGRPAYVPKALPPVAMVVDLVRGVGGVTSAAHLGERADPQSLGQLKRIGLDAVEVVHPSHNPRDRRRIERNARQAGLLPTGGSDWHGDLRMDRDRGRLGVETVPVEWAEAIRAAHESRAASMEVTG
jgi:predicted metal-dependent phosphoesterase TrpH